MKLQVAGVFEDLSTHGAAVLLVSRLLQGVRGLLWVVFLKVRRGGTG